jgi:hypothetical protein
MRKAVLDFVFLRIPNKIFVNSNMSSDNKLLVINSTVVNLRDLNVTELFLKNYVR